MKLFFSDQPLPKQITRIIFLAGPSPRSSDIKDWRKKAVKHLKKINFKGEVLIPIPKRVFYGKAEKPNWSYINQIQWEVKARQIADKIVFWIPRDIKGGLPGFTTNFEMGEDLHSGKIIYGRPDNADKCKYLDERYSELKIPHFNNLKQLLINTTKDLDKGSIRKLGEVYVPLFIWNSEQFQNWYKNLKTTGNKLIEAKLMHFFNISENNLFSFILSVKIWVKQEKRFKMNEFVFSRKDISSVIAYYPENNQNWITFIKEFRSPANNIEGFIYELPSGSNQKQIEPKINAQHELFEETGLFIENIERLEHVGTKQLLSTLSSHNANTYKLKLNEEEFKFLLNKQNNLEKMGNANENEITYVHLIKEAEIFKYPIDYSNIGMIAQALKNEK